MTEHYENIRSKTICPECQGNDMGITYLWEKSGTVKKQGTVLGMNSFTGLGNLLMITCRKCGCVAKSFVVSK
ncbi:MAG TPA: hypothetical protein VK177_15015 [Flavobacteriales bacterium]|nr:hypothetical protein [Flavobacteriales bacterium]